MTEELAGFYEGDCLEILPTLADNSVDLTVTSPPYDNLREYNGNYTFDFKGIAKELFRVTKTGGVVVWVVGDATIRGSETGTSFKQALYFKEIGFNLHDTMIYQKKTPIPQIYRKRYSNEFEYMFVLSKGEVNVHNPLMVDCINAGLMPHGAKYKNYSKKDQTRKKSSEPVRSKKQRSNIWAYAFKGKTYGHPGIFPEQLATDHILSWSNEEDTVLDPFAGSFTTAIAAINTNRKWICIEKSHEYCEIGRKRIMEHQRQGVLEWTRVVPVPNTKDWEGSYYNPEENF